MDVDRTLTRDVILEGNDAFRQRVDVPEWGGHVFVKTMTGEERDAFEQSVIERNGSSVSRNLANFRAKLAARVVVDGQGNRLFQDADIVPLGRKSSVALDRVVTAAQRLNAIGTAEVEDLTKNS